MAKPGMDRDGAMVEKQVVKKSKDKISPFTKTPKVDRNEMLGREMKSKSSMKRKLSFTVSPPQNEERDSDTDSDPGHSSETWAERLIPPCAIYSADKDGPDKKKVKKETGNKKSTPMNILFGYPLSERKQMALLMQMTARDNSPDSTPSHPSQAPTVQKKIASTTSSRQKDKVNKRNERGETPLHMAAIRGDAKQVRELISLGADVNVKDFAGWTPLHEACNLGYYDVAKVLIAAGAEVNTQGLDDDTPLHDASSSGHRDIVKLLLRHGGNAFQANKRGERPVDVADSQEVELLLKGEAPLSDLDDSSSESEDPPSVNPSSIDDNMEYSDTEKDSDSKQTNTAKASVSGLDEYEFKDEEEEEDLSKALNDRHILRREARQREKEEKDRNHFLAKQDKGSPATGNLKKPKPSRVLFCSSESSSDDAETPVERKGPPTTDGHKPDVRLKKEPGAENKEKGKVKKKYKNQSKNKENQEVKDDGKENSKAVFFSSSTAAGLETPEKTREEDSFKMSFSPKDDSSVHLFHLPTMKSPKLNHSLSDKQATPLKQENVKACVSVGDSPCQVDGIKYDHYVEADCATEGSSSRGFKHKEKSKHHQRDLCLDGDDRSSSSPHKDDNLGTSMDSAEGALRKTDKDGKVLKKHKLKHCGKDKHRKECEMEKDKQRQKEMRKDGHRNLEFDREFWKENFFKSDENEDSTPGKTEILEGNSPQKADESPIKEERPVREKHASLKDKRQKDEREKDKSFKKERELFYKEERSREGKTGELDEKTSGITTDEGRDESLCAAGMKEETEDRPVTETEVDQEQMDPSEKGAREKTERKPAGKERECERIDKKHSEKEKKMRVEHFPEKSEPHNFADKWREREKMVTTSHSSGENKYKESEKLKAILTTKKPEENKKSRDKMERKTDKEKQEKERYSENREKDRYSENREKDKMGIDRKGKTSEKVMEHNKSDRTKEKEKDWDKKKKDKAKDVISSSSNLKLLLEERKSSISEGTKISHEKNVSAKLKDDVLKTPEKDRRERDRDAERHRDRDRHKDKSQQSKVSKTNTADAEKSKAKSSPAPKDVRPKEKRLVNDDLMQTSFERMLSLKDQEIEQWHRKHMEKIKQKERERMKLRPGAELGKLKNRDRTRITPGDVCVSKDLQRSKSSEVSETHTREQKLKDATGTRSFSLDAKNLPYTGKSTLCLDSSLSRSPKPESERCGPICRSVSMISMASSEDSCQTNALTPRPLSEYDSDFTVEGSDSQASFSQSSCVTHVITSPAVHEKETDSLLDGAQRNKTPLSGRHATPYLRSILDDDSKPAYADAKSLEDSSRPSVLSHLSSDKGPVQDVAPPQSSQSMPVLLHPIRSNCISDGENLADTGSEGHVSGSRLLLVSNSSDTLGKEPSERVSQQVNLSQSEGIPPAILEPKRSHAADPLIDRGAPFPHLDDSRVENISKKLYSECNKDTDDSLTPETSVMFPSCLPAQQHLPTNAKASSDSCNKQWDSHTEFNMELLQRSDASVPSGLEQKDKLTCETAACNPESKAEEHKVTGSCREEWAKSPGPSIAVCSSIQRPDSRIDDAMMNVKVGIPEAKDIHEEADMETDDADTKDSKTLKHAIGSAEPCDLSPCDVRDNPVSPVLEPSHPSPERKDEASDAPEGLEKSSSSVEMAEKPQILPEGSNQGQTLAEVKPEPGEEMITDQSTSEEKRQQLHKDALGGDYVQRDPQEEHSGTSSGGSSPLPGDGDCDCSGARAKVRLSEEDEIQVHHPRKRKMPRVPQPMQASPTAQQVKEKNQQSLAAIVDSLKLEEIQPYQTERANPYYEFLHIRKKIEEKRKVLCSVIPQAPQYYDEYVTFNGSYLLDGNPLSKLCIPTITPPPSLPEPLKELFKQQEVVRMKLRLQHSIEREKLIVSNEQEVLRVHYRAARTLANQTLPFSACTVLLDAEVYNMPQDAQGDDGKTSVRDRFNTRQFMSWLQDVDDKFDKLKTCLLMRQQHEAAALNAVQRLEWQLKLQELDLATYKSTSIFEIPEFYIPLVDVNDDFDLTPI
ncbi:ankyrin repeat domain-containing protein 12 isoform X1 [Paramormyrops kingsleyae]|uniref:Ankyrin repeat domain 12 n=1 Tax=Paramormyrops kingsleyae TaxID=1676925 RepID=A0A3B3S6Z5_9TELE|nr:ankyrin repeat domain-containing protein 12 isoform X1 [Paramormyrops kingsleyae]